MYCSWPKSFLVRRPFAFVALFRLFSFLVSCWIFFRFVSCFLLQVLFCFLLLLKLFVSLKNFIPSFLVQDQLCSHWIKLVAASPSLWTKDKLQSFRIIQKDLWLLGFLETPPKWRMKKYLLMMGATAPASFCSRGAWLLTRSRESERDRYSSYLQGEVNLFRVLLGLPF